MVVQILLIKLVFEPTVDTQIRIGFHCHEERCFLFLAYPGYGFPALDRGIEKSKNRNETQFFLKLKQRRHIYPL